MNRPTYDFDQRLASLNITAVPNAYELQALVHRSRILKRVSEILPYDCKFTDRGCKRMVDNPFCCCTGCAASFGYFRWISLTDYYFLNNKWHKEHGFCRPKHGCILPREYRSATCITYHCNTLDKRLFDGLHDYRESLQLIDMDILAATLKWFQNKDSEKLGYPVTMRFPQPKLEG